MQFELKLEKPATVSEVYRALNDYSWCKFDGGCLESFGSDGDGGRFEAYIFDNIHNPIPSTYDGAFKTTDAYCDVFVTDEKPEGRGFAQKSLTFRIRMAAPHAKSMSQGLVDRMGERIDEGSYTTKDKAA